MPRVPEYNNFQATPSAQPSVRFNPSQAPDAGEVVARQGQQMGQALQQSGGTLARLAADAVKDANETRVIDAVNKARERMFDLQYGKDTGYLNLKGDAALRRPDNQNLADEYVGKFKEQLAPLEQELGNDQQREMFRRATANMQTQLYGDAQRHVAGEFKTYKISTYDGAVSTAQQQIALNYNDVKEGGLVDQGVKTIEAAVRMKAREMGLSQELADAEVRRAASNAHRLALGTALERNDVAFADGYLKKYRGQMTADDILHTQGAITKEMDLRAGVQAASTAVKTLAPDLAPTDFGRMVNITLQAESGGKRYGPDGKLLTSPAGAQGEMQVMPGTNKDPGFGVKPAKDNSPEERARVGRDYLQAMLKRYDGDPAMAWAAYNAGPGRLDEALMRAKASPTPGASWLTFMPNETQAYVAANVKALENGLGRPQAPTLADVQERVRTSLGADARPQVVQHAVQEATRQWEALSKAQKDAQDQSLADAQRLLIANKGDMNALPMSVRNRIDPGKFDDLMGFASKLAKGEPVETNMALYQRLSDPRYLTSLTDNQFFNLRPELSDQDFKHFATEREKQKTGPKANDPGQIDSASVKRILDIRLQQMNVDPTPKDGSADVSRVGAIRAFVDASIASAQLSAGKRFGEVEIAQHVDGLFAKSLAFKRTVMGFKADDEKNQMVAMRQGDIPADTADRIRADLAAQGIANPTEGQILGVYWTLKTNLRTRKP